jgi:hypothetical protein
MPLKKLDTVDKIMIGLWVLAVLTAVGSGVGAVSVWASMPPTDAGLFVAHILMTALIFAANAVVFWFVYSLQKGLNE